MPSKPIPIRISDSLLREIKVTAAAMEMTDQDTMRFCMRLGLKILELSEFDAVTPVAEKAIKDREVSAKELVEGVEKRARSTWVLKGIIYDAARFTFRYIKNADLEDLDRTHCSAFSDLEKQKTEDESSVFQNGTTAQMSRRRRW